MRRRRTGAVGAARASNKSTATNMRQHHPCHKDGEFETATNIHEISPSKSAGRGVSTINTRQYFVSLPRRRRNNCSWMSLGLHYKTSENRPTVMKMRPCIAVGINREPTSLRCMTTCDNAMRLVNRPPKVDPRHRSRYSVKTITYAHPERVLIRAFHPVFHVWSRVLEHP